MKNLPPRSAPKLTRPIFCTSVTERVYITAWGCESGFGGGMATGQRRVRSRRRVPDYSSVVAFCSGIILSVSGTRSADV